MKSNILKKSDIGLTKEWKDKTAESLRQKDIAHPILQRLRSNFSSKTSFAITSYDRMYHRHSRTHSRAS